MQVVSRPARNVGGRGMARPPLAGGSATGLSATSAMSMMELSHARIAAHGQKKIGRPEFLPVFLLVCAACLRDAMRENIGSVGAMRERIILERVFWSGQTATELIFNGAEGASNKGVPEMCDYSLQSVRSRPAKVGERTDHT